MALYEIVKEDGQKQPFNLLAFALEAAQQIKDQNCMILDHTSNKIWYFKLGVLKGSSDGIDG